MKEGAGESKSKGDQIYIILFLMSNTQCARTVLKRNATCIKAENNITFCRLIRRKERSA